MYLKKEIQFGRNTLSIETGKMAKQASGSVVVTLGDTVLLVTATSGKEPKLGDFMPLTVDIQSKMYSVGKIPGGYFKRENRPPESDILIARLTDRPLRPLFPEGYTYETQVIVTFLSVGDENVYESLSMTGASAALMLSPIPFLGPIAGAKVGRVDGEFILNPTVEELAKSDIDVSVAASADAIVMVEGDADEVAESVIVDALAFAHEELKKVCAFQEELLAALNITKKTEFEKVEYNQEMIEEVKAYVSEDLVSATIIKDKMERYDRYDAIKAATKVVFAEKYPEADYGKEVSFAIGEVKKSLIRGRIQRDSYRIDGRGLTDIRPIACEVGILPRVHGTGLFTRGETQGLVTTTIGFPSDVKRDDTLEGYKETHFLLHYNFPPFSVGEARFLRGPGRREIGHGHLALRGLKKLMPTFEEFPYVVRVVSEILESNGSSSMATVCGGTLSLMDAGVPIKKPVAGIAMGLIKEDDDYLVLSDILGDEDHLGDMDFKVVGTKDGITALQMDIKVAGLPQSVLASALDQAREGRLHILGEMDKALTAPREDLNIHAPRVCYMMIKPDKIGALIGPGGKNIRKLVEETGAEVDVEDTGRVRIVAPNRQKSELTKKKIEDFFREPELDTIYNVEVLELKAFGAIVKIFSNATALLHISEIANEHVRSVEDHLKVGDMIDVKVIEMREGKTSVSMRALLEGYVPRPKPERRPNRDRRPRN